MSWKQRHKTLADNVWLFIVNGEEIPTNRFLKSVLSKADVQTSSDSVISALTSVRLAFPNLRDKTPHGAARQ